MGQDRISLSNEDYAEVDAALDALESSLAVLTHLSLQERRALPKMAEKSEDFCRRTLTVLSQNPQIVPPGLDVAQAQRGLEQLGALRVRTARLRRLLGRAEDSEMAVGSEVMNASLEGYALLKVLGWGPGLDALCEDIGARFYRTPRQPRSDVAAPMQDQ